MCRLISRNYVRYLYAINWSFLCPPHSLAVAIAVLMGQKLCCFVDCCGAQGGAVFCTYCTFSSKYYLYYFILASLSLVLAPIITEG